MKLRKGGRGAVVGGDVNQGVVLAGNDNVVSLEFTSGVTYDYSEVAPSSAEPGELEEARRQLETLPLEEVPCRAALPARSVMPLRPNPHFVDREEQLKRIAANLKAGDATTISEVTVAASSGLGGVGKTQLASEFVYRYGQYFHGVYWVSFAEPGSVPAEIASCGGTKGMNLRPDFHTLPMEERVQAVMAEWQSEFPWLLVFDNCEDESLLDQWLPPTGGCRVLVTSRRGSWDSSLGVIDLPLDVFDRWESVELLRKYRPGLSPDNADLNAIAEELGDLPLALDLAGRYLDKYRREVTLADYLKDLRQPELLKHPSLQEARGKSPTKHDMDVWRTFALSYWRLDPEDETDKTAVRLLARAARLAPGEPIPGDLLAWTLEPPDREGGSSQPSTGVRDALDRLRNLGLLDSMDAETFRMHRLVATFTLVEAPNDDAQAAVEVACARAAEQAYMEGQPARQEVLLPHLRFVTDLATARGDNWAANCCNALSTTLIELGSHDEALPYAERAWDISVDLYGPEARVTLQRRSNIGLILENKRTRDAARTIYEEVLEVQERILGPEDPDVAATLNNLGASYVREDLYHETLPLYRRALRIREHVWDRIQADDSDRNENAYELAESYGNMGTLLMDLGRHGEAGHYLANALRILADEVELAHERNAGTLVTVGRVLRAQRDYPGAVSSIDSALSIYMNIGRTYSPAAANALANVGATYKEWVEEDQTMSAQQRARILEQASGSLHGALNGSEHMYGEDYPMTGGVLRLLAGVCDAQGHSEDGRRYRERAEANRQKNFQGEDVSTANVLNAHGASLMGQGLYDEAHAYLECALRIREGTLGERDFDTSTSLFKLGILLQLRGRDDKARLYLERALAVRVEVCEEDHPAVEVVRDNLRLLSS